LFTNFRYFDIFGIIQFLNGGGIEIFGKTFLADVIDIFPDTNTWTKLFPDGAGMNLTNTYWPLIILSLGGLAFKNGLYIFMLRQFFRGVPDELEESAYIDGSGVFRTFVTIILPLSIPMMITVFLFAFSWQWTDNFYSTLFFTAGNKDIVLMPQIIDIPSTLDIEYAGKNLYDAAIYNTCGIMIIAPLIIMYLFCQKYLVQGIERSGLTAD
jgi:multiple sugar transport system permease protein